MAHGDYTSKVPSQKSGAFGLCCQESKNIFNNTWNQDSKPVEMYRTDFISAMKIPDHQLLTDDFIKITDSWKQDYDKGVQVPVDLKSLPDPHFNNINNLSDKGKTCWRLPQQYHKWKSEKSIIDQIIEGNVPQPVYDMDEDDVLFLKSVNLLEDATHETSEYKFETIITYFDALCHINMVEKYQKDLTYSIQYDDSVYCEVCKDIYSETDNEMIFCDICNICVHQSCYGIPKIPQGDWHCSPCKANCSTPVCLLCMQGEGAFKSTVQGEWVHIFCALWIPEVGFGNVEKMAPITKIKQIPASRWSLTCSFCQERVGTCIQCSEKNCFASFHPTCAYTHQCHMMTSYGSSEEGLDIVKNFAYCLKHIPLKAENIKINDIVLPLCRKKDTNPLYNNQSKITRSIQKHFYDFINIFDLSPVLNTNETVVTFIFDYWKDKRKLNGNNPLIYLPPLAELVDTPLKYNSSDEKSEIDPFLKLVSLRQDLERARVLCHMTLRREKLKKKLLESNMPDIEFCFDRKMPLPVNFSILGSFSNTTKDSTITSDEDSSMNLSQSSISKIFCSPINHTKLDVFNLEDSDGGLKNDMVVAHEVVLKDSSKTEDQSENNISDSLSYHYRSSEDPEWHGEFVNEKRKWKKKKKLGTTPKIDDGKGLPAHLSRKITIELSDNSNFHSSLDESCNFSTPPNSPEFDYPKNDLSEKSSKRKHCSDSSGSNKECFDMHSPFSPRGDKENVKVDPEYNKDLSLSSQSISSTIRTNTRSTSKRHKPNLKYE